MMQAAEGRWATLGGVVDQVRASLHFRGEDLDPDALTRLLGISPRYAYRKGDRTSAAREEPRQTGYWSAEVEVSAPDDVDEAVSRLLGMLSVDSQTWQSLVERYRPGVSVMVVVKAWNRGFMLPSSVIGRLAERGLWVECDIYAEPQPLPSACS